MGRGGGDFFFEVAITVTASDAKVSHGGLFKFFLIKLFTKEVQRHFKQSSDEKETGTVCSVKVGFSAGGRRWGSE